MNFARLSLTAKLAAINALLAAALLALVAVAWRQLPSNDEAAAVAQLSRAQRATQNADMVHDALHSDVLAALLAAGQPEPKREEVRASLRANAQEFRAEFATLASMSLGPALQPQLDAARQSGLVYVERAEQMVQAALARAQPAAALHEAFDVAFEDTKNVLATQTAAIAQALDAANAQARQASEEARRWLLMAAAFTVVAGWVGVALIARSIRRSLMRVSDVANAVAGGELTRRSDSTGSDEVGQIAQSVNRMADALSTMIERMRAEADGTAFAARLTSALDMADGEAQAHGVVERAMQQLSPRHAMELLLSDSSDAHLERAAAHPTAGAPGCGVDSPFACIAVRRGHAMHFDSSDALDACPKLRNRAAGTVAATCVPVAFMGRALGVLHACAPAAEPFDADTRQRLAVLGTQIGARIGTVRAFESTQRQARTDALTGLANRRAAEARLRELVRGSQPFTFVMADLDRFKLLNDTHGHQVGDEALRLFADVVRDSLRQLDLACRWGGEEFAFVLVGAAADEARQWADRVRARLVQELRQRSVPAFTASFGIADSTLALPLEALVAAADMALYRAKAGGRDRAECALAHHAAPAPAAVRLSEPRAVIDVKALAEQG